MTAHHPSLVAQSRVWIAQLGQTIVGVLVLVPHDDRLLADNVAVVRETRDRRIGRRLLEFAEHEARARGLHEVRLCTGVAMTQNLYYYPRRGFVETHRGDEHGRHRVYFTKVLEPPRPN